MTGKIKTSIMIDSEVWEEFKVLAASKKGLKGISKVVEEALKEELGKKTVAEALTKRQVKESEIYR